MIFEESPNCPPNRNGARDGIKLLLEKLEELLDREKYPRILFEAPTGYGKSTSIPLLFTLGLRRVIHVLPLRAIIDGLVRRFARCLKSVKLGYQMMGHVDAPINKSPFFASDYVISTLDSFILNLYRGNVAEKDLGHFETPRAFIMSSLVVLDEIHLPFQSGDPILSQVVEDLTLVSDIMRIPMIFMTATFPNGLVNRLNRHAKMDIIRVNEEVDDEFFERAKSVNWSYEQVEEPLEKSIELAESGLRVLRITKTVNEAINEYIQLRRLMDDVVLIHGRMTPSDRAQYLRRIREAKIAVGTSAIEAGLDVSFDVLVTDETGPESMVQRCGRVCRQSKCDEAKVFIRIKSEKGKHQLKFLKDKNINMKIKYGENGYGLYLNKFYEEKNTIVDRLRHKSLLLSPPFHDVLWSLYNYGCAVVRNDLLIPVLPSGRDLNEVFPLNLKFLAKHPDLLFWKNDCLGVVGKGIKESRMWCGKDNDVDLLRIDRSKFGKCYYMAKILMEYRIDALVLRRDAYEDGLGIRIMG